MQAKTTPQWGALQSPSAGFMDTHCDIWLGNQLIAHNVERQRALSIVRQLNAHAALVAALREIVKGEGAYSRDPLTHAANCVEAMQKTALAALDAAGEPGAAPTETTEQDVERRR